MSAPPKGELSDGVVGEQGVGVCVCRGGVFSMTKHGPLCVRRTEDSLAWPCSSALALKRLGPRNLLLSCSDSL